VIADQGKRANGGVGLQLQDLPFAERLSRHGSAAPRERAVRSGLGRRLDVNEPATIEWAAGRAGLEPLCLLTELAEPGPAREVRTALAEFEQQQCPGVPTVIVNGQRFFGKDRVDWVADICRAGG
jgi:2-hydroxychromene-2-carboxylate isomerase